MAVVWPVTAFSAVIWQAPQNISAPTDVSVQGELVGAYNFTNLGYAVGYVLAELNGVEFRGVGVNSTYGHVTTEGFDGADGVFGSTQTPYLALSQQYRNILQAAIFDDSNLVSPASVLLSDLEENTTYLVQIWASDSRPGSLREQTLLSPGGEVSEEMIFRRGIVGSLGQYIIGTFTTGVGVTEQEITFGTNSLQVNALQLRAIPEPGTVGLLVAACGGLWVWRRRIFHRSR